MDSGAKKKVEIEDYSVRYTKKKYNLSLAILPRFEVFTLSHMFHVESTWTPGTLPGCYLDSWHFPDIFRKYYLAGNPSQIIPGVHLDLTWISRYIACTIPGNSSNCRDSRYLDLARIGWSPCIVPVWRSLHPSHHI
jgi:hypothetical protein